MNETLMTTEAATPSEGQAASIPDTQTATAAVEGVQEQASQPEVNQELEAPQLPESYEFSAPEGVEIHEGAKEAYAEIAKDLKLTQEQAQAAFEKLATKGHANQVAQLEAISKSWAEQSTADKEFGGEKLQESLTVAKKALDTFGTPELRALFNESGLGNHPEVIRFMVRAGKAVSEDKFVAGGASSQSQQPVNFYPASKMNP